MSDEDPRRRRNDPFDDIMRGMGLDPSNFHRMFEEMQRAIGRMLSEGGFEPGKPYMAGFNFKIGPDGKPYVAEFGNRPRATGSGKSPIRFSDEREPPTDVLESDKEVSVTLEMPGVEKKDIDLRVTEDVVEISVDTEARKYHKRVQLPAKVVPHTTRASYKNGVLDIVCTRKDPGPTGGGLKVNVS